MSTSFLRPWRWLRHSFRRHLSWKLTASHLLVAMLCQVVYIVGAFLLVFALAQGNLTQDSLPVDSPEMAEETRILALALAPAVVTGNQATINQVLSSLPPPLPMGLGTFDGVLSTGSTLVIVAPDGTIVGSSEPALQQGTRASLVPTVWGEVMQAALRGTAAPDPRLTALNGRDLQARQLVTAYPIVNQNGQIIGALGLRSAAVPPHTSTDFTTILASLSLAFLATLLVIGTVSGVVAAIAGFLLARAFGRRLRQLELATEAIAQGNLTARVAIPVPDEIGRVGERFNLLTERLAATDRSRRSFVSTVSHELRTPLAIIRGQIERALSRDPAQPIPRELLQTIDHEASTLSSLVDDLFTLTRIDENALPVQPEPVNISELARAAVASIQALATAQGHVVVQALLPSTLPPVLADPTRVKQILNNLLYNALRHTPAGGVIVVNGAVTTNQQQIAISVTDTGTGIAPDDLPHIFDRYYQGEGGTAVRQAGGSGLGLAVVRQLVEAQGGTVQATSTLGEGTTITLTLPRVS